MDARLKHGDGAPPPGRRRGAGSRSPCVAWRLPRSGGMRMGWVRRSAGQVMDAIGRRSARTIGTRGREGGGEAKGRRCGMDAVPDNR